jgi:type I restriction enzyme M protein
VSKTSQQIIQRLWTFCGVLRDDGLSYPDYVEQLTFLLFLKMAEERGIALKIPRGCRWADIVSNKPTELARQYNAALKTLGSQKGLLGTVFRGASNRIRDARKLHLLVVEYIGTERWTTYGNDVLGDAYEGLLDKTTDDLKSGAGQYFTPRPLVDAIAEVIELRDGDVVYDPACGTGGFLLAAKRKASRSERAAVTYRGTELVQGVARLAAMNALLHGLAGSRGLDVIEVADALEGRRSKRYSVVLTNPPFGKRSALRRKLLFDSDVADGVQSGNKQLLFLSEVMRILADGGRAAIVVPDNVLFEGGAASNLRRRLLEDFNLHTVLRLPTGIFYAKGVKANVLFFDRSGKTTGVGFYDFRTTFARSLKKRPLSPGDLDDFIASFVRRDPKRPDSRWTAVSARTLLRSDEVNLDIGIIAGGNVLKARTVSYADALSELEAAVANVRDVITLLESAGKG